MTLIAELQRLMVKYHFRPNKKFAQHFVIDESIIRTMIDSAELSKKDVVLEIGAGCGFLTRELQKHCRVIAVELDKTLFHLLESELDKKNLTLIRGNFLNIEVPEFNKIVSLPPFNISTEIIFKIIEYNFSFALFVFEREFVERLIAEPGFYDYNATSVIVNYYTQPQILLEKIQPSAFYPKPEAICAMISLKSKKRFGTVCDEKKFVYFVRTIFRLKNKNLSNALLKSYPFLKKDLKISQQKFSEFVGKCELRDIKVCQLWPKEIVDLYKELYEN